MNAAEAEETAHMNATQAEETAHMNAIEAAVKADSHCESTVLWASIRQGIDPLFELHFASMIKRKNNEPVKGFGKV